MSIFGRVFDSWRGVEGDETGEVEPDKLLQQIPNYFSNAERNPHFELQRSADAALARYMSYERLTESEEESLKSWGTDFITIIDYLEELMGDDILIYPETDAPVVTLWHLVAAMEYHFHAISRKYCKNIEQEKSEIEGIFELLKKLLPYKNPLRKQIFDLMDIAWDELGSGRLLI